MRREGKLRQVSEFGKVLRRTAGPLPQSRYAEIRSKSGGIAVLASGEAHAGARRRGFATRPEDVEENRAKAAAMLTENQEAFAAVKSLPIGRSKDGGDLSLHKSWHCLHYFDDRPKLGTNRHDAGQGNPGRPRSTRQARCDGIRASRYLTPTK
jgi:hypothetical protein